MAGDTSNTSRGQSKLGRLLQHYRELRKLSVRRAATMAEISSTYLSQLETGSIKDPSPRVLHRLAQAYDAPYAELMRAADYVVPMEANRTKGESPADPWDLALRTTSPLTLEEREALAEYLAWYRSRRGRPPENR
jgi:transcriptional regulator with XRE-family HTH domain